MTLNMLAELIAFRQINMLAQTRNFTNTRKKAVKKRKLEDLAQIILPKASTTSWPAGLAAPPRRGFESWGTRISDAAGKKSPSLGRLGFGGFLGWG